MEDLTKLVSDSFARQAEKIESNKDKEIVTAIEEVREMLRNTYSLELRHTGELMRLRLICKQVIEQLIDESRKKSNAIAIGTEPVEIGGKTGFNISNESLERFLKEEYGFYSHEITPEILENIKLQQKLHNSHDRPIERFNE